LAFYFLILSVHFLSHPATDDMGHPVPSIIEIR